MSNLPDTRFDNSSSGGSGCAFRLASGVAALPWNQWQSFRVEWVAGFPWNQWQTWSGIHINA